MEAGEFALIPGVVNPPFIREAHPGAVDYQLPTTCTTMQQHTERRLANEHLLHVFEREQMMDQQLKKHVMSCFHKDICVGLKQPRIGYTNIATTRIFEYLYANYGEKTEKLQNKALADLEEEVDVTGPSIIPFCLKQEKFLLFLSDTEQAILNIMYIKTCLRVIERTNYVNKAVLAWRRQTEATRTVALFWPFIREAHTKQRLKLEQERDEQANSVMLQKQYKEIALKISQLERYTDRQ